MNRLVRHIERLLYQHDCVIIPEFGGFVLQKVAAAHSDSAHSFTPSRKEIVFNPTLTHNDGLLAEAYMQDCAIEFEKAQQLICTDVNDMRVQLNDDAEMKIGAIGIFIKEQERIVYIPDSKSYTQFSISSYGLPVFHCLPLTALMQTKEEANANTSATSPANHDITASHTSPEIQHNRNVLLSIPLTRSFLRYAAIAVVALLLFFLASPPVSDPSMTSYPASFLPSELLHSKTMEDMSSEMPKPLPHKEVVASEIENTNTSGLQTDTDSAADNPSNDNNYSANQPTAVTSAKPSTITATASEFVAKPYFVIIGSFANKAQANKYINHEMKGVDKTTVGILVRDGRVRVYSQHFADEAEAQRHIEQLQKNPRHRQAWLYVFK
jgi:cell division septation protein DedD